MIDLLGLNEPGDIARYQMDHYRALACRKRRADLVDLIDKSKKLYPLFDPGAVFNHTDSYWRFSSGSILYFKYFERFADAESFLSGQELNCIFFDEIQQHETDEIFRFAQSRLRSSKGLKCYMRASCNPSRHRWVRDLWRIDDVGTATDFTEELTLSDGSIYKKRTKFIPARLTDNPHLPKEYEAKLMALSEADRNSLLYGLWGQYDSVDGLVFEHELTAFNKENRLCHVPFDPAVPVYTFFDIGMSDLTVVLFVQFVGKEVRIINMLKDNNRGIGDYFVPKILRMKDDLGYRYGGHYLPHDAAQRGKWDGISLIDQVRKSLNDVHQLPRHTMEAGLQLAKQMFRNVFIDKTNCADLHNDLSHYRREWDDKLQIWKDEPLHDKHSHGADAFRYISYYKPKSKLDISDMDSVAASNPFTFR